MRYVLAALTLFLTLSSVFNWDPGPAPGVKIKNFLLYMLVMGLVFSYANGHKFKIQLPAMNVAFIALVGYSIFTYLAIVLFIDYPRYDMLTSAFDLKNRAVDYMLFFLVFFYGTRTEKDATFVLKCLLLSWVVSHFVAVLDAFGYVQIGDIERRGDGRVQGAVGESNQYGAFVALTLPAAVAMAVASKGWRRWFWMAAAALTAGTLLMTVSRGAFVATFVATMTGAYLFRRYLSLGKIFSWGLMAGAAMLVILLIVSLSFGDLLYERVVSGFSTKDLGGTSSGRTEIWSTAIAMMFQHPQTLLTGFGWNAYWVMPFRYSPHNYYLAQWFNLGLPGLICSVLLLVIPVRTALRSFAVAPVRLRFPLAGFVVATVAYAAATFFVDLYTPWIYFWAYAGVSMRLAMIARETALEPVTVKQPASAPQRGDPYGWIGAVRH
ncbi:O-antigen ligase family protein [Peristeroidobacter agariperforans]|uniref:O-antigen ligase family protein n=1 Tax=Peristeroidobacter agariperforans TaxID=268404 RepID=UPI00101C2A3B|nr:O-antigen ligase family protein [Peristeroidobacter agariperforans]